MSILPLLYRLRARWPLACRGRVLWCFTVLLALLTSLQFPRLTLAAAGDWPTYLHDPERTASSDDTTLSPANAGRLTPLWSVTTGNTIAAQPVVANGTVYVGSWDGYEYALDAATGALRWKTFLGCARGTAGASCFGITATATVTGGMVYVGGGANTFDALNAATGAISWTVPTGYDGDCYNWSSPLIYQGAAYLGVASLDDAPLVQGQVLQVDLATHQLVHTFAVVPPGQIGGSIWTSPSVDAATNTLYVTTGNQDYALAATSQPDAVAILALDATTLALRDAWQVPLAAQPIDPDWTTTPLLFSDATGRPLVAAVNKSGDLYAFDRSNLAAGPVWQQPIARSGPDPQTGDASASSGAFGGGRLYQAGGATTINGVSYAGSVRALDPGTGTVLWAVGTASPIIAAVAYANGLVVDGAGAALELRDAASGALLYSHTLGGAIYGAPSVAHGRLYVGTTDGALTAFGLAPALTVTPPSGIFPQPLTLSGTAFAANDVVHVYDQNVSATPLFTGTADATGTVVITGTFPLSVYGAHTLVALGQTSGLTATATYTVKPGLLLRPMMGPGGATVGAAGSGFGAHEAVTLYWDQPWQQVGATTSSAVGAFYGTTGVTVTLPAGTTSGWHVIYALGQTTHALGGSLVYVY